MIPYITLGNTGITVSRICFGSLTVSPLGANLPQEAGAEVIYSALAQGINFIDTAQYYENYNIISRALSLYESHGGSRAAPVICSKTYAWNRELAKAAVNEAREKLDRDVIDIFMLHEQESMHTLRGHMEALEYLYECRGNGIIRAIGISTHCIDAVNAAAAITHSHGSGLDVVFPMFNKSGLGIRPPAETDGKFTGSESEIRLALREEMYSAIKRCHDMGIGVMLMKVFGSGHLLGAATEHDTPSKRAAQALRFAMECNAADSVALGMQSIDEVSENIRFFERGSFSDSFCKKIDRRQRRLVVENYCEGCGRCVNRCGQGAMVIEGGTAVCDSSKCVLCGYCAGVCPRFAIKVI